MYSQCFLGLFQFLELWLLSYYFIQDDQIKTPYSTLSKLLFIIISFLQSCSGIQTLINDCPSEKQNNARQYLYVKIGNLISLLILTFLIHFLNCNLEELQEAEICKSKWPSSFKLGVLILECIIEYLLIRIIQEAIQRIKENNFFPISEETLDKIEMCETYLLQGTKMGSSKKALIQQEPDELIRKSLTLLVQEVFYLSQTFNFVQEKAKFKKLASGEPTVRKVGNMEKPCAKCTKNIDHDHSAEKTRIKIVFLKNKGVSKFIKQNKVSAKLNIKKSPFYSKLLEQHKSLKTLQSMQSFKELDDMDDGDNEQEDPEYWRRGSKNLQSRKSTYDNLSRKKSYNLIDAQEEKNSESDSSSSSGSGSSFNLSLDKAKKFATMKDIEEEKWDELSLNLKQSCGSCEDKKDSDNEEQYQRRWEHNEMGDRFQGQNGNGNGIEIQKSKRLFVKEEQPVSQMIGGMFDFKSNGKHSNRNKNKKVIFKDKYNDFKQYKNTTLDSPEYNEEKKRFFQSQQPVLESPTSPAEQKRLFKLKQMTFKSQGSRELLLRQKSSTLEKIESDEVSPISNQKKIQEKQKKATTLEMIDSNEKYTYDTIENPKTKSDVKINTLEMIQSRENVASSESSSVEDEGSFGQQSKSPLPNFRKDVFDKSSSEKEKEINLQHFD